MKTIIFKMRTHEIVVNFPRSGEDVDNVTAGKYCEKMSGNC